MTDEPISTPDHTQSDSDTDELELTDEQQDALVLDRNVTITAGAGTGKTTTLTHRYLEFLRSNPECLVLPSIDSCFRRSYCYIPPD